MENTGSVNNDDVSKAMVEKLVEMGEQLDEVQKHVRRLAVLAKPTEKLVDGVERMNKMAVDGQELMKGMVQWRDQMQKHVAEFSRQVEQHEQKNGINELNGAINKHIEFFSQTTKKEIHHKHFIGKPLTVIVMLVIVAGISTGGWMRALKWDIRSAGNDLKWRYMGTRYEWRRMVDSVENWYNADPRGFEKQLEADEKRRHKMGY